MILILKKLIRKIKLSFMKQYEINFIHNRVYKILAEQEEHRKNIQSNDGRIRILEEQQEIMHNYLVEINKYLVNFSEYKKQMELEMTYQHIEDKEGRRKRNSEMEKYEGESEKKANKNVRPDKMKNQYKPKKGI